MIWTCPQNGDLSTECGFCHREQEFTYPHTMWTFPQSDHNLLLILPKNVHILKYKCPQTRFAGLRLFSCLRDIWLHICQMKAFNGIVSPQPVDLWTLQFIAVYSQ